MNEQEQPETTAVGPDTPVEPGTPPGDAGHDPLAEAEAQAAREAAEETRSGPKVVEPTAKTSRKAAHRAPPRDDAELARPTDRQTGAVGAVQAGGSAETLVLHRTGSDAVSAVNIDVSQGGIGRAQATDIALSQGGIGLARGERVSVEMGAIGAAFGSEVRLTQGAAGSILARDVRIEQAGVRTIVANHVTAERTTGVVFLLARRVDGDVRAVLDWRGALAFGAAFGLIVGLLRRRR
jgi:hypothetical protein